MRLAVIGSKEFHDYQKLKSVLDEISGITTIVSGAAVGTDTMAARYAEDSSIKLLEFPPDHEKYGEEAKLVRDRQIVDNCDQIIAFWDGECAGTDYTINYAKKKDIQITIVEI